MPQRIIVERGHSIPMRDGVRLAGDLYRPDTSDRLPVLIQRTPYGKGFASTSFALWAAENGYAVVIQDTRGFWASEGQTYPFLPEKNDGYDTLEWIARQPWSNGSAGMFGDSYPGYTQLAAASTGHPSLKAIVPSFTFCDPHVFLFRGGALNLGAALSWSLLAGAQMALMRLSESGLLSQREQLFYSGQLVELIDGLSSGATFRRLPLEEMPLVGKDGLFPLLADILAYPYDDERWEQAAIPYSSVQVPAFHIGGWYDIFIESTLQDFAGIQKQGSPHQKALVGPWVHASVDSRAGEADFGLAASAMQVLPDEILLRWFDHWLKGEQNGVMEEPPVRIFIMGKNTWRDELEWPLSRARQSAWYLHSQGSANSLAGDGRLSLVPPQEEPSDSFLFDPRNPVPSRGGGLCCWDPALPPGVYDQRPVEGRSDVLVYTSSPLASGLEVTGPVELSLWAASSAPDTDFTAKLVDVSPSGYARNLADGIVRTGAREGKVGTLLEPGRPYSFTIVLGPTSNYFEEGHCIRLEISSSSFPRYNRNPNTGGEMGRESELRTALQAIFHEAGMPSFLKLPVVSS